MMATQTKVSSLGQVVQEHIFKSHLKWALVVLAALVVVLVIGSIFNASLPTTENESGNQRAFAADEARYTAMAKYYAPENDVLQRGIDANATRYSALAEYYATVKK